MTGTMPQPAQAPRASAALAARLRAITARELFALLPHTAVVSASTSIALVLAKQHLSPSFPYAAAVVRISLGAVVAALIVRVIGGRAARSLMEPGSDRMAALEPWVVALHVGLLLLIVPVVLLTKSVPEDDMLDWTFSFLNKRWLIGLYAVAVATVLVVPLAVARWLIPPSVQPRTMFSDAQPRRSSILGTCAVVVLCWYAAGPPWNISRHHRAVDWHEQAVLGPLQAISKGYVPYIGPASTGYGPGCQLLLYALMTRCYRFDIVGFRMACAALNFAALLAVAIAACRWMHWMLAGAIVVLLLAFSPFAFFATAQDGTFAGLYGWGFALRYLAPILVVPALGYACVTNGAKGWSLVWWGTLWGAGAWVAQENLSTTVVAAGLLLAALWLTRTIDAAGAGHAVRNLAVGFTCATVPVLVWYATIGQLGTLLNNYFAVPHAVAVGYSNMWWPAGDAARWDRLSYYFTAPFALALGLCALWRVRELRPATPLDWPRVRLFAFISVLLACYQTVLFRSDYAHLINTMIALPFVLVLGVVELPRWLASTNRTKVAVAGVFVALSLSVYPTLARQPWAATLARPVARFQSAPGAPAAAIVVRSDVARQRATPLLANEPLFAGGSGLSMPAFLDFAAEVHETVGQRKTFIVDLGARAWTGALYFFADLTPAPYLFDREMMTINADFRARAAADIATHPSNYECVIGTSLDDAAVVAFLRTHPDAIRLSRLLPAGDGRDATLVHILLANRSS